MGPLTSPKTLLNNTCPYPLMLVSVVTEHDVCCGVAADDRRVSKVRIEPIIQTVVCCCGASETVKMHAGISTGIAQRACPLINKVGGCCGTVGVHSVERSSIA
jgi:hypothetical protein